jgi:hypothetical protein
MASVFLLQHCRVDEFACDNIKVVGIYSSRQEAEGAVERLRSLPGFRDHPHIIDALSDEEGSGFTIDDYWIDEDNWVEGFGDE